MQTFTPANYKEDNLFSNYHNDPCNQKLSIFNSAQVQNPFSESHVIETPPS